MTKEQTNLPEQLHSWYLEAVKELKPESFNPNANKPYSEITDEQKSIDIYIANKITDLISQEKEKLELYKEAYEELLELRGYLTTVTGNFEPNIPKLKKYWGIGKSDWEKKLNLLQNK